MSEFNAALGLAQLSGLGSALERRAALTSGYFERLEDIEGVTCHFPARVKPTNFGYFPIFIEPSFPISRDELHERMAQSGVYTRRYFYPLISEFPAYRSLSSGALPIAARAATSVLCLPLYPNLTESDQDAIVRVIRSAAAN
jgi:dTDP-4-amino-4,6-dideoxygalactose transaminase